MQRVCAAWVPHFLRAHEIERRREICTENLARIAAEPDFLDRVITVDESYIHHYDPKTKRESETWQRPGEPRSKKIRQQKSAGKVLLVAFFDCRGMVYQHVCPPHTKINKEYYLTVLKTLKDHIRRKRSELIGRWVLHQDNATPHTAAVVQQWFQDQDIELMPHSPYSPDLAPCNFWLFPTLKRAFRGHSSTRTRK